MPLRQGLFVAALTALYLCFELAFNARLLDVVGSAASADQIHRIEVFGRTLSGCALALVVLQWLLKRRARDGGERPAVLAIAFWCAAAGVLLYVCLHAIVDRLAQGSDPAFRRASLNILLVQRALVRGHVELDGLGDDPSLFARPAGKAFLALLPGMAASVDRLDEKIDSAKLELTRRQVADRFGGPAGYYEAYVRAVGETRPKWEQYRRVPADLGAEIERRHHAAWNEYSADLGRRGWTPSSVPRPARAAVARKVRQRIAVPPDWDPANEAAFRAAVAAQVRKRSGVDGEGRVAVQGSRMPAGLSWPAFFVQPAVQQELRKALGFAPGTTLAPSYATAAEFERQVFAPAVADIARRELARYEAPVESFADGGVNAAMGVDAARAAIVPPFALFFSLAGAIGHLAKLAYLLLAIGLARVPALQSPRRWLWLVPAGIVSAAWIALSAIDNPVTSSRLYGYMQDQVRRSAGDGPFHRLGAALSTNALHVVAVGQDHGYPLNEFVRTRLLGGITYGYDSPHQ